MKFMIMHKVTDEMERGLPPDKSVIEGVGKLVGDALREKRMIAGAGLKPTSQRSHIVYSGGKRTITDGPFAEAKELVGGYAQMRVRSKEEAIAWCDKFAAALGGDVEVFLGPVVEPWDLGVVPKPADAPLRFLAMHRMDARSEAGAPPDPALFPKIAALTEEMTKAGVFEGAAGLLSTKHGARLRWDAGGKRTITDGPFAESKELVAGFVILDLPSKEEAVAWAIRFREVVKVNEIDVRLAAG
jgi:hypothetical protein